MTLHEIIRRPLVTEKGVDKKETERTLCSKCAKGDEGPGEAAVEKLSR
jgi:hypothetical protein